MLKKIRPSPREQLTRGIAQKTHSIRKTYETAKTARLLACPQQEVKSIHIMLTTQAFEAIFQRSQGYQPWCCTPDTFPPSLTQVSPGWLAAT